MDPRGASASQAQVEAFGRRHRTGLVTLVFTDMVGSTALKQQLGDHVGAQLIEQHHALVRATLKEFPHGEELSTAGDSFFLVFATPSAGVKFALTLQQRLRELSRQAPVPVQDRMGLHLGEVLIQEADQQRTKDLIGLNVDLGARVMGLAQGGQILLTRAVFDSARQALKGEDIPGVGPLSWLNHGLYQLKGIEEAVEICEVGEVGAGPLRSPATTEKARRVEATEGEAVLGWRPAVGQAVPNTRWVLERKLGEGGFGEVWLGRNTTTKQARVFKFCFQAERVRFLKREMTLFRVLKERMGEHPNIVRLNDVYLDQPPFYVEMEYVEGEDLRSWCERQGGVSAIPLETRLEIVAQAADGLQAAHDAGIIHRDIKPANILVSGKWQLTSDEKKGEPRGVTTPRSSLVTRHSSLSAKLTDFGIGQVVSEEYLKGITRAGFTQTMASSSSSGTGTQLYMAPELLAGNPASTRSDIYSLGVVLYQFLVGDFRRPLVTDWAKDIADPLLREDLQHCFMGDPEQRFVGAGQLARNLRAWRERTAERAERERLRVQTERRRRVLVAGGLIGLVLAALAAALGYGMREAQRERERQRQMAYASDMKAAHVAVQQNNRGLAMDLLERHVAKAGQKDLRGIEWRYLWREANGAESLTFQHSLSVNEVALSPNGRLLATASGSGWDKWIRVWDIASGKQVRESRSAGYLWYPSLGGFTPDDRCLVFQGMHDIEVRETSTWALVTNLPTNPIGGVPLAMSSNGRCLVMSGPPGYFQAWDPETGAWRGDIPLEASKRSSFTVQGGIAVSADGAFAALSSGGLVQLGPVVLWDIPRDKCTNLLEATDVLSLAFSRDGRWLAWGDRSGQVGLWELRTRRQALSWHAHQGLVYGLAFSPDGKWLTSGGNDQVITFWEAGTTNRLGQLPGHRGAIQCLAFSADGRQIASGSSDNTAKIWAVPMGESADKAKALTLATNALPVCLSTNGAGLFTLDEKEPNTRFWIPSSADAVSFWSCQSGERLWSCSRSSLQPDAGGSLAFFLKARTAVGFGTNGVLHLWDLASRKELRLLSLPFTSLKPACLSPDQRWLVAQADPKLWLLDLHADRPVKEFPGWAFFGADFSPDGQFLALATSVFMSRDWQIHLWDLKAGKERFCRPGPTLCTALRFSPDSRLLASTDWGGEVQLWSVETGKPLWPALKGHQSAVTACCFSADGKTLITSGLDATLRFWSVAVGQEMLMLPQALPMPDTLMGNLDILYRAQTDVNPVPDVLLWHDQAQGTRLVSLPKLSKIDQTIARRRERLTQEMRQAEDREQEVRRQVAIATAAGPGAITHWLILGPIPLQEGHDIDQGLDAELVPNEAGLRPRAGERVRTKGGEELTWQSARLPDSVIDLTRRFGPAEHVAAYAVAYVSVPVSRADLNLLVGADENSKIYLNGRQVYRETGYTCDYPETVSVPELKAGTTNVLVFKVISAMGLWSGYVRFTDAVGKPVPDLRVVDSPP